MGCHWKKLWHILQIVLPPCLSLTSPYLRERNRESIEEKIDPKIVPEIVVEIDLKMTLVWTFSAVSDSELALTLVKIGR